MTKEDIIRMAQEAGFVQMPETPYGGSKLEKFAKLVAEHERRECAKLCAELGEWFCVHDIEARGQA